MRCVRPSGPLRSDDARSKLSRVPHVRRPLTAMPCAPDELRCDDAPMSARDQAGRPVTAPGWISLALASAATLAADEVLIRLESTAAGLSLEQARVRLAQVGANALRSHGARPLEVLLRQLRNPLL